MVIIIGRPAGYWVWDASLLDIGDGLLDIGRPMGYWLLDALRAIGYWTLRYWILDALWAIGYWP